MRDQVIESAVASESVILAFMGRIRSPFESRLLRWAVAITLAPFVVTLLLDGLAALRLGLPEEGSRHLLASLFDPVYQTFVLTLVVTAGLMVAFFDSVPRAFIRLAEQRVIDARKKGDARKFVDTYQYWLYHPARYLAAVAFAAVGLAMSYYVILDRSLRRLLPGNEPAFVGRYSTEVWLTNWINGLAFPLALYVGGILMWKLFATAMMIYKAPEYFEFDIQPAHPDKCGGFKSVGDLCLKMVYVILVPALFLSFWLIVSKYVTLTPDLLALLPPYVLDAGFRTPAKVLLALLALTSVAAFFWPMFSIHRLMLAERTELQTTLDAIARQIHQLDRTILAGVATMSTDDRKKKLEEIDSLKGLYELSSKTPTWPFERSVALKFVSSQAIPFVSLLGLGGPLSKLAEFLAGVIQNG